MRSVYHNDVDQSFKKFASSVKNLAWESPNKEKQSRQYAKTLKKISKTKK